MAVAVVIPTYYRNDLLREAIKSAVLSQPPVTEIIIVDGSGESHAEAIAKSFDEITYLAQDTDNGVAAARDEGVNETTAEWIRFLDDDDVLVKGAIKQQLTCAEQSNAGVVYGAIKWPNGTVIEPDPAVQGNVLKRALAFDMAPCVPSTMLVHRKLLDEIGPTASLPSDDHALNIKLAQRTKYAYVDEVVARRNSEDEGLGGTVEVAERRAETLAHYREHYDEFPPEVLRQARARVALRQADSRITEMGWSPAAIFYAAQYCFYDRSALSLGYFLTSLFGQRARDFGKQLVLN